MGSGEICILAGGLSTRMGRDKARLRLGGKTLLRRVKDIAGQTGWPVRVIRRDAVARCGPLGGIYTALKTTSAERVLFLACDMPFVTIAILDKLIKSRSAAVFTRHANGKVGFPFILHRKLLPKVEQQIAEGHFSLQALATRCRSRILGPGLPGRILLNLNTPADLQRAEKIGPIAAYSKLRGRHTVSNSSSLQK